jgi:hypothetical protein
MMQALWHFAVMQSGNDSAADAKAMALLQVLWFWRMTVEAGYRCWLFDNVRFLWQACTY